MFEYYITQFNGRYCEFENCPQMTTFSEMSRVYLLKKTFGVSLYCSAKIDLFMESEVTAFS
jgi:hypothetical protein